MKGARMKRTNMYCMVTLTILCTLTVSDLALRAANRSAAMTGPTTENALAAEEEITKAIRENNANAITSMLDDDWAVINTSGGVGEGKSIFPEGIKSGYLTRKTMELSEPRVRLYGDVALITSKLKTSGMFGGKPFDVTERQTDVLVWKDGAWKSVLTHETKVQ
jgi:ketosteroid isomerase-like protein